MVTKNTARKGRKKQPIVKIIEQSEPLSIAEQEREVRDRFKNEIKTAITSLNTLIELQKKTGTVDRSRFLKFEVALRRNVTYTKLFENA